MPDIERAILYKPHGREVIVHTNGTEYYFSTSHVEVDENGDLYDKHFVPITASLPMRVVPRPSVPDGMINTVAELVAVFHRDETEIENPHPEYSVYAEPRDSGALWGRRVRASGSKKRA